MLRAFLIVLAGCTSTHAAGQLPDAAQTVRVQSLEERAWTPQVTLHGVTRAVDRAELSFPMGGRLVEQRVRVGDRVQRGQVLARLDAGPYVNQEAALEARADEIQRRLEQLDRELGRLEPLAERGSVADAERERVQTDRAAAAASLRAVQTQRAEARRQHEDAALRAPFDGVVVTAPVQTGETVGAGRAVVELAGEAIEVQIEVPERIWAQLERSTPAVVVLPALDIRVDARIVDLAEAGGSRGLFPVVVQIPAGPRRVAGLTARVELALPDRQGLLTPVRAVVDPTGGAPSLFVVREGQAHRVPVELDALAGDAVVVRGPTAGDEVVVAGQARLLDGQPVEVIRD